VSPLTGNFYFLEKAHLDICGRSARGLSVSPAAKIRIDIQAWVFLEEEFGLLHSALGNAERLPFRLQIRILLPRARDCRRQIKRQRLYFSTCRGKSG
jgi:hypothetical protein